MRRALSSNSRCARELWDRIGRDVTSVGFRANGSLALAARLDEWEVMACVVDHADASRRGR
ncbi:MAG: hypothetical protein WAN30_01460 [Acidimicrobiales bacterium]